MNCNSKINEIEEINPFDLTYDEPEDDGRYTIDFDELDYDDDEVEEGLIGGIGGGNIKLNVDASDFGGAGNAVKVLSPGKLLGEMVEELTPEEEAEKTDLEKKLRWTPEEADKWHDLNNREQDAEEEQKKQERYANAKDGVFREEKVDECNAQEGLVGGIGGGNIDINLNAHNFGGDNNDVGVLSPNSKIREDVDEEEVPEEAPEEEMTEPEVEIDEISIVPGMGLKEFSEIMDNVKNFFKDAEENDNVIEIPDIEVDGKPVAVNAIKIEADDNGKCVISIETTPVEEEVPEEAEEEIAEEEAPAEEEVPAEEFEESCHKNLNEEVDNVTCVWCLGVLPKEEAETDVNGDCICKACQEKLQNLGIINQ